MTMIIAKSDDAKNAYELVRGLQKHFADKLSALSTAIGEDKSLKKLLG